MIYLTLDQTRTKLAVQFEYRVELINRIKMFSGRIWKRPFWLLPLTEEMVKEVELVFSKYDQVTKDQLVLDFLAHKAKASEEVLEWKQDSRSIEPLPGTVFVTEPYKHQRTAVALCQRRNAFALFMEMGTGKTKVIIDLFGDYLRRLEPQYVPEPILIVAPVAMLFRWQREAATHQPNMKLAVAYGGQNRKVEALDQVRTGQAHGVIINYESFWRMEGMFDKIKWWGIVLDESTKIKHRATQQARALMRLGMKTPRKYILTGTPMSNSPLDLFNQIKFLDPTVFGSSWYAFRDRYAVMGGYGGYQVLGWKNLDELTRKLAAISFRVLKKDCLDLPEKVYKEYRIPMDETQKKYYKELAEELVTSIKGKDIIATVVLAKITKLRQIAAGFVYTTDGTISLDKNPKLNQFETILADLVPAHKVVVWTSFIEEERVIVEACKKLGTTYVVFGGNAKERDTIIEDFQTKPDPKVFICQLRTGGVGITLTAADYCIFFSNEHSYEIRAQAEDRLHRSGQKNQVVYIDLIMKGTCDSTIKHSLTVKEDLSKQITPEKIVDLVYDKKEEL